MQSMALTATHLRCEYRTNPLGIDSLAPRLSWELRSSRNGEVQRAYQIIATPNKDGNNVLWDSGKVASADAIQVAYAGKKLTSGQRVFWRVRVWNRDDQPGPWSKEASFEIGLLTPADWSGAQWIRDPKPAPANPYADDPLPLFGKSFTLPRAVKSARLSVTGLGYFEASVNGVNPSDAMLEPGWTNYEKRVYYRTLDVTKLLKRGENALEIFVGNGWWNPMPLVMFGGAAFLPKTLSTGRPRCIARLEVELSDGAKQVIVTDTSWSVRDSALRFQNNYIGEVWDAREAGKGAARQVVLATEPVGPLQCEPQPPIKVIGERTASVLSELKPGVFLLDAGVNQSGRVRLTLKNTKPGQKIALRYGELLNKDGTLNPMTGVCGQIKGGTKERHGAPKDSERPHIPAIQEDTFICAGGAEETFQTHFVFRGFRYVEVSGPTEKPALVVQSMAASVESAGEFSCSEPLLNQIQEITRRTFLSNLFSVQSDCPHREKFGYGGDIVATRDAFLYNFDMAALYGKIVTDYVDAARPDGSLPDTAPYVGIHYCGVGWPMALPLLQVELLRYYGDKKLIEAHYAATARWLEGTDAKKGLTDHEARVGSPTEATLPLLYAECARLAEKLATTLGKRSDAAKWRSLAQTTTAAYQRAFPDAPPIQACLAYALEYGKLDQAAQQRTLDRLLADLQAHNGHLTTGIYGTKFMFDSLSRLGHADAAFTFATKKTVPSWGAMLAGGATTLWEHWDFSDNTFSHNHPMFGSISAWFFAWLAGIQPAEDAIGFDKIELRPQFVAGLSSVKASYRSLRGPIKVEWKRLAGKVALTVEIPIGCTATLHLPGGATKALESGKHTAQWN